MQISSTRADGRGIPCRGEPFLFGLRTRGPGAKKSPPKETFASEALANSKIVSGTSSRRWRSVARGYW